MSDVRAERCEELRQIIIGMTPVVIEAQGNAGRLPALLEPIGRLRAVAAQGVDGIDDPVYRQWVSTADQNLGAFEDAARRGDAAAAWAAFADQRTGVNLLSTGCAGCSGW